MGQYAVYIWPCFIMAFALMILNIVYVWLEWCNVLKFQARRVMTK